MVWTKNKFHDTRNFKKTMKAYFYKLMQTFFEEKDELLESNHKVSKTKNNYFRNLKQVPQSLMKVIIVDTDILDNDVIQEN